MKNTLNSKVNNWAIEISPFCNTFEYIKGIKNTLADTMSRLINIDPQEQQDSEPEGYEFGYYTFDTLPMLEVSHIETTQDTSVCVNDDNDANNNLLELPINNDTLFRLKQERQVLCKHPSTDRKRKHNQGTGICNPRQTVKKICCRQQ